jgi:hypothetical protein
VHATHIRTRFVRAAAAAAILLSMSVPIVSAGPGDGEPSSDNTDPPPGQVLVDPPINAHASENPVVFQPHQDYRTIQALWTSQPVSEVVVKVQDNNGEILWQGLDHGVPGKFNLGITYGHIYHVWVCRWKDDDSCSAVVITTVRKELNLPTLVNPPVPYLENRNNNPQLDNEPDSTRRVPQTPRERRVPSEGNTDSPVG